MIWTTDKPTVPGWYWTKSKRGRRVTTTIQRVKAWRDGRLYLYAGKPVERHECEWAGPISMPEEGT